MVQVSRKLVIFSLDDFLWHTNTACYLNKVCIFPRVECIIIFFINSLPTFNYVRCNNFAKKTGPIFKAAYKFRVVEKNWNVALAFLGKCLAKCQLQMWKKIFRAPRKQQEVLFLTNKPRREKNVLWDVFQHFPE